MTMNSIDTFPENLPLRASLPKMRPETITKLIHWACHQPGSMSWLLRRKYDYQDQMLVRHTDEDQRAIEATCALELLRHRIASATDREAVEHLGMDLHSDKVSEAADET